MAESDGARAGLGAALGLLPSGLFVLTLRLGERTTGLLLSWVQQCGFDPPSLSFCLRAERFQLDWLRAGAAARLHVLGEENGKKLLRHFSAGFGPEDDAFRNVVVELPAGHAPLLPEALAWLKLRPMGYLPVGDHVVVAAQVLAGQVTGAEPPWVHVRKSGWNY